MFELVININGDEKVIFYDTRKEASAALNNLYNTLEYSEDDYIIIELYAKDNNLIGYYYPNGY